MNDRSCGGWMAWWGRGKGEKKGRIRRGGIDRGRGVCGRLKGPGLEMIGRDMLVWNGVAARI